MTEIDSIPPGPDSVPALSVRSNPVVRKAIETLLARFEEHGYNPTPVIDLGVIVAAADGKIEEAESKALRTLISALLGTRLGPQVVDHLVQASREVLEQAGMEPRVRLVAEILLDCEAVEPGVTVALAVAFSKEGLNEKEREIIQMLARAAHMSDERLSELTTQVAKTAQARL